MNFYRKILYLLPLATLLVLVGCGPSGDSFRINGTIDGMESGEIYIFNTSEEDARFDTIHIENSNFYYGGTIHEVTPFTIIYPNAVEQVIFIGPGDDIDYEVASNSLNNYEVSGSEENDLMNEFRTETQNTSYSSRQAKARKFITEHTQSVVALYLYYRFFVQNPQTTYKELNEVLDILRPNNKDNKYFQKLQAMVKAIKPINTGDKFPNLKLKGKHGYSSLWKKNSTYTVFLMWTTWTPSSYEFLSKYRDFSNTHAGSDLRLVSFSIDNDYRRWDDMVRYDSLTSIEHYIDTEAFESQVIKKLGTSEIPTYFLLDSKHKVLSKGTTPQQLDADIRKYK